MLSGLRSAEEHSVYYGSFRMLLCGTSCAETGSGMKPLLSWFSLVRCWRNRCSRLSLKSISRTCRISRLLFFIEIYIFNPWMRKWGRKCFCFPESQLELTVSEEMKKYFPTFSTFHHREPRQQSEGQRIELREDDPPAAQVFDSSPCL